MCGRYGYSERQVRAVAAEFGVGIDQAMQALFDHIRESRGRMENHAPTMRGPVLRSGHSALEMLPWGFMSAPRPDRPPHLLINARSETVSKLPSFREPWRHQRCLVIADYFYEWDQQSPKGSPKQPWRFTKADESPMVFAGIWSPLKRRDGAMEDAYAILTTTATPTVARLHDRMPVILQSKDWRAWIDPATPPEALKALHRPYDGSITATPVTPALNKANYQGPVETVSLPADSPGKPEQGQLF